MTDDLVRLRRAPFVVIARPSAAGHVRALGRRVAGLAVREVSSRAALEETVVALRPAVLFLDLSLPGAGGLAGVPAIQRLSRESRIILLARSPNETHAVFALLAGAKGLLSPGHEPDALPEGNGRRPARRGLDRAPRHPAAARPPGRGRAAAPPAGPGARRPRRPGLPRGPGSSACPTASAWPCS